MFNVVNYGGPALPGPRARRLDQWKLTHILASDKKTKIWKLSGITVSENGVPVNCIRLTTTSPIADCKGALVTTASGSRYFLLEPNSDWLKTAPFTPHTNRFIPKSYCNPWIQGDNWKTI